MEKTIRAILFLLISVSMILSVVEAQQISPGVTKGDSFSYDFYTLWISASSTAAPADLIKLNDTRCIQVSVTEIGGTVVVMNVTRHFKNGTATCTQLFVNILNGMGTGFGLVIAPNLEPKSFAYYMGLENGTAFQIREAMIKTYPFGEREVLHAIVNQTGLDSYARISHDMYFDKKTGVMLEWICEQIPYADPTSKVVLVWKILEFNVKGQESSVSSMGQTTAQPQQTEWFTAAVLIVICAVGLTVLFRKRMKRHRVKQQFEPTATSMVFDSNIKDIYLWKSLEGEAHGKVQKSPGAYRSCFDDDSGFFIYYG